MNISERLEKIKDIVYKLFDIDRNDEISVIEEAEDKVALPDEYLERFTLFPLQSKTDLRGRENELNNLERAFDNWKITHSPLLIVTNPGEGATSLLHSSTYIYPNAKIFESKDAIDSYQKLLEQLKKMFRLDQDFTSLKDFQEYIVNQKEGHVVIIENIERLFIRKIYGFNLLEDFLLFLHGTKQFIYWIISVNKYSFYYLNSVKFFSSHFSSTIQISPIADKQIKEDILLRNKGYQMVFLKPSTITKKIDKQLKKVLAEERQELLSNLFFKKLFDFSKGNMSKAILFARNSAHNVKDKKVYIKPYTFKPIEELSLNELFVLEAIFQHSALTIKELNIVLRNSNRQSQLTIEKLLERDLIRATTNNKGDLQYRINLMYLDELKNILRERLNRNIK